MTVEEIKERLEAALPLRIPLKDPSASPRERVEAMEDYLLKTAWHRADLEEALHWGIELGKMLKREWEAIQGWQATVGRKATKDQVDRAKRDINPGLWDALEEARTLVQSLQRQISRFGGSDYEAVSRAYTMLTGS